MTTPALYVVAHEDDDLLFLSPNLLHDLDDGRRVVTVFVTSGDAGLEDDYWLGREAGIEAAYALMAGAPDDWVTGSLGARALRLRTLRARPEVSVVFLRLPDGFPLGTGSARRGRQSLQRLLLGDIGVIDAVDDSASYTHDELVATLGELMELCRPADIHVQDYVGAFGEGDHSDHYSVAFLAQAAAGQYGEPHTLHSHECYPILRRLPNLPDADVQRKSDAFSTYASHDPEVGPTTFAGYLPRQYLVDVAPSPPPEGLENVASSAFVTASSANLLGGQAPDRVVDDRLTGFPDDPTGEWATVGGGAGSWVELTWESPVTVSRCVLFDRPNLDDRVTSATLEFSDGTTVETGPLDNRGFRTDVPFPPRTVTSVRLVVDAVGPDTANVGLAELQLWGFREPSPDL